MIVTLVDSSILMKDCRELRMSLEQNCAYAVGNGRRANHLLRRDSATMRFDEALPGVISMSASFVDHRFAPHMHDELMIGSISEGSQAFFRDGREHVAPPGSISIVNPGDVHTGRRSNGDRLVYRALYVPMRQVEEIAADIDSTAHQIGFQSAVLDDAAGWRALEAYHDSLERLDLILMRETLLYGALLTLLKRHAVKRPLPKHFRNSPAAHKIREFLHAGCKASPSIKTLAGKVGLSPFQTIRVFQRQFGMPPHAYLIQLKVEAAKRLLAGGSAIAAVAVEVGFSDQAHLNRHFRRMTGITPGAYQSAAAVKLSCSVRAPEDPSA
jgi:AraC-like DNA-binding protein